MDKQATRVIGGRIPSPCPPATARSASARSGGFIAKNYPDLKGIGVRPEWDQWACEAFLSAGT